MHLVRAPSKLDLFDYKPKRRKMVSHAAQYQDNKKDLVEVDLVLLLPRLLVRAGAANLAFCTSNDSLPETVAC
jgi:hypothetical protein